MENYKVNDIIDVKITAIRDYGALILADNMQKGLLHISEVSNLFVSDINEFLKLDEIITVKVLEVDDATSFLKVSLKQLNTGTKKAKKHRHHEVVDEGEIDFTALKNMLPTWIKNAKEQNND